MTVNAIIEQLYKSVELDDCIKKTVRVDHREDFKQELFLILSEIQSKKLFELYYKNEIKYFVVRIILNLVNQKRNVYHKKYLDTTVTYNSEKIELFNKADDPENLEEREAVEEKELRQLFEIDCMDERFNTPYYKMLVYLIHQQGSMRSVSRLTGIPVSSISEAVKKVRNHLLTV